LEHDAFVSNQRWNQGGKEEATQAYMEIRRGADDETSEDSTLI